MTSLECHFLFVSPWTAFYMSLLPEYLFRFNFCNHFKISVVSIYEVGQVLDHLMADLPRYMRLCLQSGKLAFLAILVSGGIVLQILVGSCCIFYLLKLNVTVKLFFVQGHY